MNILCGCSNQKNRIVFEENSAAEVFFEYISLKDNSILNSVTQIELNNNVNAGFHILEDAEHSNLINRFFYNVNKDCNLNTSTCAFNGNLIQNRSDINFLNTGSTAVSSGLVFAFENQNFNNLCFVNHKAAYCSLKQDYKTIADADGQSEFYGLVKVDHGAIKTDASQSNNNIMLSKNCKIESNPQLEIYADDVKCNHGSTTGMLNADAIYYMQTRGISRKTAETLLIKALTDQSAEMCNNMAYAQLLKQKIDDNTMVT